MKKSIELSDPNSCLNKARDDERLFILLGRDVAAPAAIRAWIAERIRLGKNQSDDLQIVEATEHVLLIEQELQPASAESKVMAAHPEARIKWKQGEQLLCLIVDAGSNQLGCAAHSKSSTYMETIDSAFRDAAIRLGLNCQEDHAYRI